MFQLTDIRKKRAWKDAYEDAYKHAEKAAHDNVMDGLVEKLAAKGMTHKEIAELLEIPVREVRRLAKEHTD